MQQIKKYFGKQVSLLSTSDVRYDGEFYTVDPQEQSIALKHVNCMGTEDRRTGDNAIAPSDCTYEFIIFRAENIHEFWSTVNGKRRTDLADEVLIPLRNGLLQQLSNQPSATTDIIDVHPKRRVGSYSRQQPTYENHRRSQYQSSSGYAHGFYDENLMTHQQRNRRSYAAAPPVLNTMYPPLPTVVSNIHRSRYRTPARYGYNMQPQQRRRRRYNNEYVYGQQQSMVDYYPEQGTFQSGRYDQHRQQRRRTYDYDQHQNRNYRNTFYNQRNRYYPQQMHRPHAQQTNNQRYRNTQQNNRSGTGESLAERDLRGQEINIHDQDFDFTKAKFKISENAIENGVDDDSKNDTVVDDGIIEHTKVLNVDKSGKYNRDHSFFDNLQTNTRKNHIRIDLRSQQATDSTTFGSVAQSYRSEHLRSNRRRIGNGGGYGYARDNQMQGYGRGGGGYGRGGSGNSYGNQRWVYKRRS